MKRHTTVERQGEIIVVRIPMELKKRNARKEIIVPGGLAGAEEVQPPPQEPLVTALARAFHWQEFLDSGRYPSITDLAKALDVDRSYVGRVLQLTLLAPDIVESIVEGREPSGLSLERIVKTMPMEWQSQRAAMGFKSAIC